MVSARFSHSHSAAGRSKHFDRQLSDLFGPVAPQTMHDPGRVLVDLAVTIADGGEAIQDIGTLVQQPAVFEPVASDSTCGAL
jgi:hypothetical protein